jgi:adenosylcobalamin-dependent ribonucleoside-triphosphate reductase
MTNSNYLSGPSTRAQVVTRRTYNRPLDEAGGIFETWEQTVDRVIGHQRWLWERAVERELTLEEDAELTVLRKLMVERKVTTSGRTLWLGGTDIAKTREASQFNCSFLRVETVSDIADGFWLLLQGCGVGFEPITGVLNGFASEVELEIIPSTRTEKGGRETNKETFKNGVWTISIGDSAMAWAKAAAKVLAAKRRVRKLVLDFSEIRPAGLRLNGYGWISSGYEPFAKAMTAIVELMNRRVGQILSRIDILDVMNLLGTTLSSRRSAEIAVIPWVDPESEPFAVAKRDYFAYYGRDHFSKGERKPVPVYGAADLSGEPVRHFQPGAQIMPWGGEEDGAILVGENEWVSAADVYQPYIQRAQSNNSLIFYDRPTRYELFYVFDLMAKGGGSEPGFINGREAHRRAPWFKGVNPCAEILLGNKSFCNLVETDAGKFNGDLEGLQQALYLAGRANYRQTCVDLRDEVLQASWHELNTFLRLCGVGLTGIVRWEGHNDPEQIRLLRQAAQEGAHSMADELGLTRSKAITTIKPSGTLSKIMDTTEGIHRPLGRYVFNNINFSKFDPIIPRLKAAGYKVFDSPVDDTAVLVCFPVCYEDVDFDVVDGKDVNLETAVQQLERYKLWMDNYVDHNCSITISYSPDEVPAIIDWLLENWSHYVGVSFIYRNDPTKTAADLGYQYLPQEVVTREVYEDYLATLSPLDWTGTESFDEIADPCSTGACPIK